MTRYTTLAILLLIANAALAQHTVPTRATFVIRDDMGRAVTNAEIEGGFRDVTNAGSRDRFKGLTDTNGMLVAEGNAMIGVGGRITAGGYYQTITSVPVNMNQRRNLDRWDVEIPVLLKRIRNPIPMFTKGVENIEMRKKSNDKMGHYMLSSFVGYDLVTGNMVPPYGRGEVADVGFDWNMTLLVRSG